MAETILDLSGNVVVADTFRGSVEGSVTNTDIAALTSLTDSSTGTANDTVTDVGATFDQATLNNNFADLAAKINAIIAALQS